MSAPVARTCTEIATGEAQPLSAYRSVPAYVLLGDPGAGKTTEFRTECQELGDTAVYVTARSLVVDVHSPEKLDGRTLFIDGLDEMRAGATDARVPLDEVRQRLVRLGRPSFRISCREADWLGPNDRRSLEEVSPDSQVTVLLLDRLSDNSARELLAEEVGVDHAAAFEHEARRRGLEAMLRNPQMLKLLARAVGRSDEWPESRLAAIEAGCRRMASEHDRELRDAVPGYPPEANLDVAGHLCAVLLLCGFEGYTLAPGNDTSQGESTGFLPLDDLERAIPEVSRPEFKAALGTNLFAPAGEREFDPCHRQIAEFLAARCLGKLIAEGLPARRVIALMTGPSDGRVVTALRGLSAWLAAHAGEARRQLIDADPVGVGLYGDIGGFTHHDRERLLRSLVEYAAQGPLFGHAWQDDRALVYGDDTARAFRSLASADMLESIRSVLRTPVDQPHRDRTAAFMLEVLSEAEESEKGSMIPLVPELMMIMRDPNRPPGVTARALDAYIRIAPPGTLSAQALVDLLEAIRDGLMPDPDESMRVALLDHLFPSVISAAEVWRCGLPRPGHNFIGSLSSFWHLRVLPNSSDECIAALLDALSEGAQDLVPALAHSYLDDLPVQLLARGLRAFGDTLDMNRLFGWLDVAGKTDRVRRRDEDHGRYVRGWLENRPHVQKAVFLLWLRHQLLHEPDRPHGHWFCDALHDSKLPGDFGLWCLDQATALEYSEPNLALVLLDQSYFALADSAIREGLSLSFMRVRIGTGLLAQRLAEHDRQRSTDSEIDDWRRETEERREQRNEKERQRQEGWQEGLRSQIDELRSNRFFAPDLHTLAQAYLGMFSSVDRESSPRQRINDFIGGDEDLVDAVMEAIRGAVYRDDVPTVNHTVSLHAESKQSWLAFPVLASLHLIDEEDSARLDRMDEDLKRKALAIHYCVPAHELSRAWHDRWFQQEPRTVLDVLYRCAVAALRAGEEVVSCINDLNVSNGPGELDVTESGEFVTRVHAPDGFASHDDLVHDTRLRLLDSFPTRSPNKQLSLLDELLARVIQHPKKAPLRALALGKLQLTSMNVGQRIRWMAVDALLSEGTNLTALKEYVRESEVRVQHLAEFLHRTSRRDDMRQSALAGVREPEVLRDVIEVLGPSFGPVEWGGYITLGMEMSELLRVLIAQLGTLAGDDTERAFRELIDNPRLGRWRDRLNEAHERQRVVHRDASYRHPSIEEVQRTLGRGAPANAADLAALLQDRIADVSADVRGDSSNMWRQFWSDDRQRFPTEPKHEDSCRDALLAHLKERLPVEVDAAPEGRYAADNRADIRATCSEFNVPIEIKKNSHPDLWTAMRRQLMGKYTTNPATSGYGIYLVMWFGANETKTPPDGHRPDTPEALRQRLEQELTPDETRKISVIVMDVTKPGG